MRIGDMAGRSGWRTPGARVATGVVCAWMAAGVAGCAARPAVTGPAGTPALVVPVIPQRVYAPLPEEPVAEPQPTEPEEPRPAPTRPARPRPRPERQPETRPVDPAKPEPTQGDPAPAVAPSTPAPPLRTPQIADETETGRRIRATIDRAATALDRVKPAEMSNDGRMQYDTARRFVDQADGALSARNYMFAAYLADKAEALASGLVGR